MADPITREQVERAIDAAYDCNAHGIHDDGALMTHAVEDAAKARAWGYEIEGGPEPVFTGRPTPGHTFVPGSTEHGHEHQCAAPAPDGMRQCGYPEAAHAPIDDTAPERLRERREALGWDLAQAAEKAGWHMDDIHALEGVCPVPAGVVCKRCPEARVDYDAALTAEEQRRAQEPAPAPAPEVVDVPQPEPWHARLVRLATEAQAAGKTCAEAEAAFRVADAEREKVRKARAAAREACDVARKALTAATTAAVIVEAAQRQQGGAS